MHKHFAILPPGNALTAQKHVKKTLNNTSAISSATAMNFQPRLTCPQSLPFMWSLHILRQKCSGSTNKSTPYHSSLFRYVLSLHMVAFSSFARILGECSTIHSLPALLKKKKKRKLALAPLFHSLCQDQSTVAQRADTTVAGCSLTICV